MDFLIKLAVDIFIVYAYISAIIVIRSFITKRDLDDNPIFGVSFFRNNFFYFGAFLLLMTFCINGFDSILFFLPDSWGNYKEPETLRGSLSILFALITSIIIISITYTENKIRIIKQKIKSDIYDTEKIIDLRLHIKKEILRDVFVLSKLGKKIKRNEKDETRKILETFLKEELSSYDFENDNRLNDLIKGIEKSSLGVINSKIGR